MFEFEGIKSNGNLKELTDLKNIISHYDNTE